MARSPLELQAILKGVVGVADAYFQPPGDTKMEYPCIRFEPSPPNSYKHADNVKYVYQNGYTVIVIDRDPLSLIPSLVEELPHTAFDRYYRAAGLHHFAFRMFF